jgi:hypothetical protein
MKNAFKNTGATDAALECAHCETRVSELMPCAIPSPDYI